VLLREFHVFLARIGMQPLLFLFVFTFILRAWRANLMATAGVDLEPFFSGLMACIMFSGISPWRYAFHRSSDDARIDDRVMCRCPVGSGSGEVCFSPCRAHRRLLVIPWLFRSLTGAFHVQLVLLG